MLLNSDGERAMTATEWLTWRDEVERIVNVAR